MNKEVITPLLEWYQKNKRTLPWRENPTGYHIWISEIMLQQTRVEAVKSYYERFMREVPDVFSLAEIPEDRLLKLWEGLGYYNRARNLKKAATMIVEDYEGRFPDCYEDLIKLPGIGDYTAGAVASIAFLEKVPAVDGNVLRVISRIKGSYDDISLLTTKNKIREELLEILPNEINQFNQALMELGALICVPNGKPLCVDCPLASFCLAHLDDKTSVIPVKTKKQKRRIEEKTIFLITDLETVLIEKRKDTGLLAGLYEFPNVEGFQTQTELLEELGDLKDHVLKITVLEDTKHIFSHIEWHMKNYLILLDRFPKREGKLFVTKKSLNDQYSLPSAFSKVKKELLDVLHDV